MRLVVPVAAAVLAAAALATTSSAAASVHTSSGHHGAGAATHTRRVVVRPVDRAGDPVAGWTVRRERGLSVSCSGASPATVSKNVLECFPSAAYLPACWKSGHHTVLCLRDARTRRLVRVRYTGTVHRTSAPKRPSPLDLALVGGQACSLRVGGAWATLPSHPHWTGDYSCDHGTVYGPASGDGVNRSHEPWTVREWVSGSTQRVVVRDVRTAYVVGTHR